ncbi:17551_t:CDS:2 [Gigaspora rosea]|nr:17551_t:CDS:2 [Gigaspora rosea]
MDKLKVKEEVSVSSKGHSNLNIEKRVEVRNKPKGSNGRKSSKYYQKSVRRNYNERIFDAGSCCNNKVKKDKYKLSNANEFDKLLADSNKPEKAKPYDLIRLNVKKNDKNEIEVESKSGIISTMNSLGYIDRIKTDNEKSDVCIEQSDELEMVKLRASNMTKCLCEDAKVAEAIDEHVENAKG